MYWPTTFSVTQPNRVVVISLHIVCAHSKYEKKNIKANSWARTTATIWLIKSSRIQNKNERTNDYDFKQLIDNVLLMNGSSVISTIYRQMAVGWRYIKRNEWKEIICREWVGHSGRAIVRRCSTQLLYYIHNNSTPRILSRNICAHAHIHQSERETLKNHNYCQTTSINNTTLKWFHDSLQVWSSIKSICASENT